MSPSVAGEITYLQKQGVWAGSGLGHTSARWWIIPQPLHANPFARSSHKAHALRHLLEHHLEDAAYFLVWSGRHEQSHARMSLFL